MASTIKHSKAEKTNNTPLEGLRLKKYFRLKKYVYRANLIVKKAFSFEY